MPFIDPNPPKYKPVKEVEVDWDNFGGGWNDIFKPTELKGNELSQATNLMLVGKGTPTGRWGSKSYHLAGDTGRVRLLDAFYVPGGAATYPSTNILLGITDDGLLTQRDGASFSVLTGASFASGVAYQSALLGSNTYIARASLPLVRFDGVDLLPYIGLGRPSNTQASFLSSVSGTTTWSWLVTAVSKVGETNYDGTMNTTLQNMPLDLSKTVVRVEWDALSAASGTLQAYNVYRGFPGEETFVGTTGADDTTFQDEGGETSNTLFPPISNTTTGPRGKYILIFDDRMVIGGIANDPNLVLISGRYPYHDRFTAAYGGGSIPVSPDDGDEITGLGIAGNQGMGSNPPPASAILVFKKNSVHRIVLSLVNIGNFVILDPQAQLLTASNGCSSGDTVVPVENDTFYFGRKGLYSVGQEPNFLNQIRTNELSARIRSYVRNLTNNDFNNACAGYMDNKYILSFPDRKESIIYDRERAAFMGPWKTPFGITKWLKYIDETGTERWLAGCTDGFVREFSDAFLSDSGTAVNKFLRTKKEDMGNWSVMKIISYLYLAFRNVRGNVSVNVRIEDRSGTTVITKSFEISSSAGSGGYGSDPWGSQSYGESSGRVSATGEETVVYSILFKTARIIQIEVKSTGANDNWEFLNARFNGQPQGPSSLPANRRV